MFKCTIVVHRRIKGLPKPIESVYVCDDPFIARMVITIIEADPTVYHLAIIITWR